LPRRIGSARRI